MRKIILVTGLLTALASPGLSQCPTAGFSIPDSVCAGSTFQVTNTSASGSNFLWDFCANDLESAPVPSLFSNLAGLNFPQQLRLVVDNGNFHIFVANLLANSLIRYDFGNSLSNTPVTYDYGSIGGLLVQPAGLDVINEGGNWYALISNVLTHNIVRVDMGAVIANNSAAGTDLGLFNLNTPRGVKIAKDGTDYYAFISNADNNDLTKITFGTSIANTPTGFSALTDVAFNVPWGFDIAYDCSLDKWVGFYASNALSLIHVIDFGTTLANAGTIATSIASIPNPSGLVLAHEGKHWNILVNSLTNAQFQKIKLSGNLLSTPVDLTSYSDPQATSPRNITYYNDSTGFHVFIVNNQPSTIRKLMFNGTCTATPLLSSSDTTVVVTSSLNNDYQLVTLEVTGTNGQTSYFTDSIYISEAPQANFVYSLSCEGQPVTFTDSSIVNPLITTTWLWDFGDSSPGSTDQNPVHLFPDTGTYIVTLTVSYPSGCTGIFSDSIYVAPLPLPDFTFLNNQCSFVPVTFTDLSQAFGGTIITDWQWNFGDTTVTDSVPNPVHTYTSAGTFPVTLTVTTNTGCIDSVSINITILPSPVAGFTVLSTCIGEVVEFTNTTTIQGGIPIVYYWDFGDSDTSDMVSPTHQYAAVAANYDVTLVATANNGCVDSLTQNIRISNQPVAQFNWLPAVVCKGNAINFTSTSSGTNGDTISMYIWDFGDGNFSADENPVYAYADTGFFDVTLTVVSPSFCDSSITQQLYVTPSPTAMFTASGVCHGLTTGFNPLTTTPPNTVIDSIVWTFGDGNGFTGLTSPSHTYLAPGSYLVTMTVFNNVSCTGFFSDLVDVYPLPTADFTYSILCSDSAATFDGSTSTITGDSITSWIWDFDGLGTSTGEITSFVFQNAGAYDVTLFVTSSNGCSDTLIQSVSVIQSPEFDFTFNEPCFGTASNFVYIPDLNPAPNAVLSWNFGDGTTSSVLSPSHIYSTVDTFMVCLKVVHNATSCAATICKNLVVKPYPIAGFSFNNSCENLPVQFNDTSTIQAGIINTWDWNFGILGTSSLQSPVITPTTPASYPVILTVTSAEGCSATTSDTLMVFANPEVEFIPDPLFGAPPLLVNFINNTTGANSYFWNFGDGSTSTLMEPGYSYQDTGVYQATLVATSSEGCSDSSQAAISVLFPYLDLAVNKVFATLDGNLVTLIAEIANMGNVPVNSFQLAGIIDNGSVINEAWVGLLQPGASVLYEFTARYDLSSKVFPEYYCVEVLNPNNSIDRNPLNNIKCGVTGNSFQMYTAYPNPFNDQVTFGFNQPEEDVFNIQVYDALGQIVYESLNQPGSKGYNKISISTITFRKGIYLVRISYRDNIEAMSIIKY